MDLLPGLWCGAHVAILSAGPNGDDFAAGASVQRFWLTAESLELRVQPEMAPLIFSRYAREDRRFAEDDRKIMEARTVADRLEALLGPERFSRAVFLGRIGYGPPASSRSLRLVSEQLRVPITPEAARLP
jgi:hypothetical protein